MGFLLAASLFLGASGAWAVARSGHRLGLLDLPNDRSSHRSVTPKGGGVGIAAAGLLSAVAVGLPVLFFIPLGLLAGLALLGDRMEISPKLRLPAHLILAGVLVVGTTQTTPHGLLSVGVMAFWVVFIAGTANFYNFMDGINGIAGLTGVVGFGLLAAYANLCKGPAMAGAGTVALCISLACLGFLPWNMPKARVFMGDVGSVLLGAAFAGLVCLMSSSLLDFVCMASFLFPFYADELTTMLVRLRYRENLTQPHRRHVYQLLANEKGLPHWQVTAGYALLQLLVGLSVLAVVGLGLWAVLMVLAVCLAAFVGAGSAVRLSVARRSNKAT